MTEPQDLIPEDAVQATAATPVAGASNKPTEVVIEVQNPTQEELVTMCTMVSEAYPGTEAKGTIFKFKRNEDKETKITKIRKEVVLALPYPNKDGVLAIAEAGGKVWELLLEAMETVVNNAARDILADDENLNASTFPMDKVLWEAIANQPKSQRRGAGIPKEVWEAFSADYCAVMPAATGKPLEKVAQAAKIFLNKLQDLKNHPQKDALLDVLTQQLAVYSEASQNFAQFADCVDFLVKKSETLATMQEKDMLDCI